MRSNISADSASRLTGAPTRESAGTPNSRPAAGFARRMSPSGRNSTTPSRIVSSTRAWVRKVSSACLRRVTLVTRTDSPMARPSWTTGAAEYSRWHHSPQGICS